MLDKKLPKTSKLGSTVSLEGTEMSDAGLTSDDSVAMASVSAPRKRQKWNNRGGSGDEAAYAAMKFRIVINNHKKEILQLEKEKADLSARLARVEKMLEKIAGPNIDWADDVPTISVDEEMVTEVTPSAKNAPANNIASIPPQGLPDKWVCSIHGNNEDVPTSRQVDELKSTKAVKSSSTAFSKILLRCHLHLVMPREPFQRKRQRRRRIRLFLQILQILAI